MRIADARLYHYRAFQTICDRMEEFMRETGTDLRPEYAEIVPDGTSGALVVVAATDYEAPADRMAFRAPLARMS